MYGLNICHVLIYNITTLTISVSNTEYTKLIVNFISFLNEKDSISNHAFVLFHLNLM